MDNETIAALWAAAEALEESAQADRRPTWAKKYQEQADRVKALAHAPTSVESALGRVQSLREREAACWAMADVFLHSKDAHGLHDMGVEIQGIQWAIRELEAPDIAKSTSAVLPPNRRR
jgi:hypothetical protein